MVITIPETVMIKGAFPWPFASCVEHVMDTCPALQSLAGARCTARVAAKLLDQVAGTSVEIRYDDWKAVIAAFVAPSMGYCPPLESSAGPLVVGARTFMTYLDLVSPP